jgi:hypothetical protein
MDFTANLTTLYAIFGEPVIYTPAGGAAQPAKKAIYNRPGSTLYGGDVLVTEHTLRYMTADFPAVARGDGFTIGGATFVVREAPQSILDGAEFAATLAKV